LKLELEKPLSGSNKVSRTIICNR